MPYVLGAIAVVFLALMIAGALTGRVRPTACCAIADPTRDLRMRGAFDAEDPAAR